MRDLHCDGAALHARCEDAEFVAQGGRHPGFIVGGEGADAIAERLRDERRILGEPIGGAAVGPALVIALQFSRQIPVVERCVGLDAARQQAIDETIVKVDAGSQGRPRTCGLNSRPGDGEEIVHQHVELVERLDVVPPECGDVDGVPGTKLGHFRGLQGSGEARKAREIRMTNDDQAHRLAGRREVERADVEISDLVRRKHRKSPPAGHYASEVIGVVEMRGNAGAVADPDGLQHRVGGDEAAGVIEGREARQINGQRHRTAIQHRCVASADPLTNAVQHLGQQGALGLEIKSIQCLVIEEAAVDGCGRLEHRSWVPAVEGLKIGRDGRRRGAAGRSGGPFSRQAAQNSRPPAGPYNLLEQPGVSVLPLGDRCSL